MKHHVETLDTISFFLGIFLFVCVSIHDISVQGLFYNPDFFKSSIFHECSLGLAVTKPFTN